MSNALRMDQRAFQIATRLHRIKGKQWHPIAFRKNRSNLAYFLLMQSPLVANGKARWFIAARFLHTMLTH